MSANKEPLLAAVSRCRDAPLADRDIVRKMFLLDPAFIFKDNTIVGYQILNSIAQKFHIPLTSIKIAGSSQTGFSPFKDRDFLFGKSDLDIAIVSPELFQRYTEIVYAITNGYRNTTAFQDKCSLELFEGNLKLGFFRPDLMPSSKEKTEWFTFFESLTNRYSAIFIKVSGGIYFSELFFEGKQMPILEKLTST